MTPAFGFALYLLGAGCIISGLAQAEIAFVYHGVGHELTRLSQLGYPVGALMTSAGLVVAWRATAGAERRVLAVAAVLYMAVFGLGLPVVARSTGWALSLGLVTFVIHRVARAASAPSLRTWPTKLGAALLATDALLQALALAVPRATGSGWFRTGLSRVLLVPGALGFLVLGAGLVVVGRSLLRGAPARG